MAFLNEPEVKTLAVPEEPRRVRWVRPLLKAAFVVVLLLCLVSGSFLGWQRVRRGQALESVLKVPPTDTMYGVPEPRSWELGRQDVVNLLKDDPHWFFPRLMKTLEQGNETQQINAVKTLDWLMPQIKSRSLRKHALETVLESLHRGAGSPGLETQLVTVASNWVDKTGVDLTRRAQIRACATASSPSNQRLAHAGSPELRYWAAYVLLSFSDDVACVPDVIAQLRSEKPTEKTGGSMPIHLLRNRFAENFFWDADAWGKWWAEQTEFERD